MTERKRSSQFLFARAAFTAVCGLSAFTASAVTVAEPVNLMKFAVSNEAHTAIQVYGTVKGSWNDVAATRVHAAFDGNTSTYTDLVTMEAWGGVGFDRPVRVTKIRHYGRTGGYSASAVGALVQGANKSDFSDAVTVWTCKTETTRGGWVVEEVDGAPARTEAFRFYRVYTDERIGMGRRFADFAELEFWGYDMSEEAARVAPKPAKPTFSAVQTLSGRLSFRVVPADANATHIEVQRRDIGAGDEAWRTYWWMAMPSKEDTVWVPSQAFRESFEFRFRAYNAECASDWSPAFSCEQPNFLSGTYFGKETSHYKDGVGSYAFDGQPWSWCELFPYGDSWVGLDFGAARRVIGVRCRARQDSWESRANDIVFEVASRADFSDAVQIADTGTGWKKGESRTNLLASAVMARYGRFRSKSDKNYNLNNAEFLTDEPTAAPVVKYFAVTDGGDITNSVASLEWYQSSVNKQWGLVLVRSLSPNGPWSVVAEVPSEVGWQKAVDTLGNELGYTYHYALANVAGGVMGPVSSTKATYVPWGRLERGPSDYTKLKDGCTLLCNGSPWNGLASGAAKNVFDDLTSTYGDIISPQGSSYAKIGVDFGRAMVLKRARCCPRKAQEVRSSYMYIAGTDVGADGAWMDETTSGERALTAQSAETWSSAWFTLSATNTTPCRSFLAVKYYKGASSSDKTGDWLCALSELEFYGYPVRAAAVPTPAAQVTVDGVVLTWEKGEWASSWSVERRTTDGVWQELGTTSVPYFADLDVTLDGSNALYRVTAEKGAFKAASAELKVATLPAEIGEPWRGAVTISDGSTTNGVQWAKPEHRQFSLVFRFACAEGASLSPVVGTALIGATPLTAACGMSAGYMRIERAGGRITFASRVSLTEPWVVFATFADTFGRERVFAGVTVTGGDDPLSEVTLSDATLSNAAVFFLMLK